MKTSRYIFYIALNLICLNCLCAQEECLNIFNTESIISICETPEYIYCGTEGHGLLRIDKTSSEKKYWNTSNSNISGNNIKSVIHYDNNIYMSSDSSLMYFHDDELIEFNDTISGLLLEDSESNLLVGGDRLFYKLDSNGSIMYRQNLMEFISDECCAETTSITLDSDGNIWLSHKDFYKFDILKLDINGWSIYNKSNSILPIESAFPNQITSVGNEIYITSANGLHKNIDDQWILVHSDENPSIQNDEDNVDQLWIMPLESYNNNLWVAANDYYPTNTGKIAYRINGIWNFIKSDLLKDQVINTIQQSSYNSNSMLVGTSKGLIVIDKECLGIITNSIEENLSQSINLYPNPTTELIHLKSELEITLLEIYDSTGQLQIKLTNPISPISLASLLNGSYLVRIYSGNKYISKSIILNAY